MAEGTVVERLIMSTGLKFVQSIATILLCFFSGKAGADTPRPCSAKAAAKTKECDAMSFNNGEVLLGRS